MKIIVSQNWSTALPIIFLARFKTETRFGRFRAFLFFFLQFFRKIDRNGAVHGPRLHGAREGFIPIAEAAKKITDLDADAVNAVREEFQATLRKISRKFSNKT